MPSAYEALIHKKINTDLENFNVIQCCFSYQLMGVTLLSTPGQT